MDRWLAVEKCITSWWGSFDKKLEGVAKRSICGIDQIVGLLLLSRVGKDADNNNNAAAWYDYKN